MKTPKSQRLQVVCAWCRKLMYEIEDKECGGGVSHGICEDCKAVLLKIQAEELKKNGPSYWKYKI